MAATQRRRRNDVLGGKISRYGAFEIGRTQGLRNSKQLNVTKAPRIRKEILGKQAGAKKDPGALFEL